MANKIYKTTLFLLMIVALYMPYFDFYRKFTAHINIYNMTLQKGD